MHKAKPSKRQRPTEFAQVHNNSLILNRLFAFYATSVIVNRLGDCAFRVESRDVHSNANCDELFADVAAAAFPTGACLGANLNFLQFTFLCTRLLRCCVQRVQIRVN